MCDQVIDIGEHLRGGSGKLFGSRDVTRRDFRQEQAPESLVELDVRVSAKVVGLIENRYVQSEYGACGSAAALTQLVSSVNVGTAGGPSGVTPTRMPLRACALTAVLRAKS